MEHESRPVILRQAVDDLTYAAVHLIDDEILVGLGVEGGAGLVEIYHLRPVLRPPKVVGSGSRGDRERPGLDTRPPFERGQGSRDLQERVLEKIVGGARVADESLELTPQRTREILRHIFERIM
jgi:hypothetical protein